MPTLDASFRNALLAGAADRAAQAAREELCEALAEHFRSRGEVLWVGGWLIGPDRVNGESPFGFGSDATVGLATVVQIAGQLVAGAVALLRTENRYAAAALIRQLVEVEYLVWAFAEDEAEAMAWLRSSRDERLKMWQPRHMRQRATNRFRGSDYANHCERGGHPTPDAKALLPGHTNEPLGMWWLDLANHSARIHDHFENAERRLGETESAWSKATGDRVADALGVWHRDDPVPALMAAHRGR